MAGQRESGLVCDQQRDWDLGSSWFVLVFMQRRVALQTPLPGCSRVL